MAELYHGAIRVVQVTSKHVKQRIILDETENGNFRATISGEVRCSTEGICDEVRFPCIPVQFEVINQKLFPYSLQAIIHQSCQRFPEGTFQRLVVRDNNKRSNPSEIMITLQYCPQDGTGLQLDRRVVLLGGRQRARTTLDVCSRG